jgi:hypothetical protein
MLRFISATVAHLAANPLTVGRTGVGLCHPLLAPNAKPWHALSADWHVKANAEALQSANKDNLINEGSGETALVVPASSLA